MKGLTKLEQIQTKIIDSGILLSETRTNVVKAATIKLDGIDNYAIFFDTTKFNSSVEEYVALAHEFYHVDENALYTFDDSLQAVKRREFKANFALIKDLVPLDKLLLLIKQNHQRYEIAEELTVTEDLIDEAIRIYKQKGMI